MSSSEGAGAAGAGDGAGAGGARSPPLTAADQLAENQAVSWLDEAALLSGAARVERLRAAAELLLHGAAAALQRPAVLERLLAAAADRLPAARRQLLAALEGLARLHPHALPHAAPVLVLLARDPVVGVVKRAIQAAATVLRHALLWLCAQHPAQPARRPPAPHDGRRVWEHLTDLKVLVLELIDSDNEGVRTHAVKFLEEVVVLQTAGDAGFGLHSLPPPPALPYVDRRALEDEAEHVLAVLLEFLNSQHISSVNLMACTSSLVGVCRARPALLGRVCRALRALLGAPPPTLSASQATSVRKHVRVLLLPLARRAPPQAAHHLAPLLADLGLSAHEVARALPRDRRAPAKRAPHHHQLQPEPEAKRPRAHSPPPPAADGSSEDEDLAQAAEVDAESDAGEPEVGLLAALARPERVVRLVTATLARLPAAMPPQFARDYEPIPDAGGEAQRRHLAALLLPLLAAAAEPDPAPPPPALTPPPAPAPPAAVAADERATLRSAVAKLHESAAAGALLEAARARHLEAEAGAGGAGAGPPPPTPSVPRLKHKVKLLRLQEITRPLPKEVKERLSLDAVRRVLGAEAGSGGVRDKLLATFATGYGPGARALVLEHVTASPEARLELALCWLYEEYAVLGGFARAGGALPRPPARPERPDRGYERLLSGVAAACARLPGEAGARLLRRVCLGAPLITDDTAEFLRHAAAGAEPGQAEHALALIEELCVTRPPRAHRLAPALLHHCLSEHEATRALALAGGARLHALAGGAGAGSPYVRLRSAVHKHALLQLGYLALDVPPPEAVAARAPAWSDAAYARCAGLALALLPQDDGIIVEVCRVYACAGAEARRGLLRALEPALRAAVQRHVSGPGEALPGVVRALLEECPRGADAVLVRLLHIATEAAPPSAELVSAVREASAAREHDARLLVPVLAGLSEAEALEALPGLVRLGAGAAREALAALVSPGSPVRPERLLVALHLVEPAQADLKHLIRATAQCFAAREAFPADVVGAALQRLAEEERVPVLLLRSVLQALALHPGLAGLALHVLQLLLERSVWERKVQWEGWLKCVERLVPRSCFLLAALPARALRSVPRALVQALRAHADTLAPAERALLAPHVAELLARQDEGSPPHAHAQHIHHHPPGPHPGLHPHHAHEHDQAHVLQAQVSPAHACLVEPLPPGME